MIALESSVQLKFLVTVNMILFSEMELRNGRSAYDDDIFVQKPILPYSSMFLMSSTNP